MSNIIQQYRRLVRHYGKPENIIWTTENGEKILVGKMTYQHIGRAVNYVKRKISLVSDQLELMVSVSQKNQDTDCIEELYDKRHQLELSEYILRQELARRREIEQSLTMSNRMTKLRNKLRG